MSSELDAFLYDSNTLQYWASKDDDCKLRMVGNLYAMTGYAIAFQKGSKWVEKMDARILEYHTNGESMSSQAIGGFSFNSSGFLCKITIRNISTIPPPMNSLCICANKIIHFKL